MTVYETIILISWLTFIIYWVFSAFKAKRNTHINIGRNLGIRMIMLLIILIVVKLHIFNFVHLNYKGGLNPLAAFIGVLFCVCGISFAIWARYHLGRNWGMPMSLKKNPELVTTGPYTYVRHPIYSGLILAMLGSALAANSAYFLIFILSFIYFTYSALNEEKLMLKQFPTQYQEYMRRTKMIIPFVL